MTYLPLLFDFSFLSDFKSALSFASSSSRFIILIYYFLRLSAKTSISAVFNSTFYIFPSAVFILYWSNLTIFASSSCSFSTSGFTLEVYSTDPKAISNLLIFYWSSFISLFAVSCPFCNSSSQCSVLFMKVFWDSVFSLKIFSRLSIF